MIRFRHFIITVSLCCTIFSSHANPSFEQQLLQLQTAWAIANYQQQDEAQELAFNDLQQQSAGFVASYPERAEAYIWHGIILSTQAGVVGGLSALDLAKQSKHALEQALSIDAKALDGSAYTSLGTLYFKVPGWPFGFGDDELAADYLKQALAVNPGGIDANYFYAEFLYEEGEYNQAAQHLQKALAAPDRAERALADQERRREIRELLAQIEKKLSNRRGKS
jgi:tetratricopeptide (TPR) repeat protein